jgi:nucleolar protein 58
MLTALTANINHTTLCTRTPTQQNLKKFLTKNIVKKELSDKLAVADSKLGGVIKEKLEIKCINDSSVMELMRGIRLQLDSLLTGVGEANLKQMRLGLSHSLSRYKLKFSADKVSVFETTL